MTPQPRIMYTSPGNAIVGWMVPDMSITLRPEQEQALVEAVNSGLAYTTDEALDQAIDTIRRRRPQQSAGADSPAEAVRRLATFGERHGLSLAGLTVKELLHGSRP